MSKIHLIIWSKDRACQLDLLLRSLEKFASELFDISVIFRSSNDEFAAGYKKVHLQHPVNFIEEQEKSIYELTTGEITNSPHDSICFSTDDMVFYRKVNSLLKDHLSTTLFSANNIFSFRLGRNTILQNYHTGELQQTLGRVFEVPILDVISWFPYQYHPLSNYGYPFALDTHVFQKDFLLSIWPENWRTTNELETQLFYQRDKVGLLSSFEHSVSVNIPINSQSGVTRAGEVFPATCEFLNENFLNNKRLSLKIIEDINFIGCHQEVPLSFEDEILRIEHDTK